MINTREEILIFSREDKATYNRVETTIPKVTGGIGGKNGKKHRMASNVIIDIAPVFSDISPLMFTCKEFKDGRSGDGRGRKGQKPVKLIKRLIEMYSNPGDIVVDVYCGTGTTAIAAMMAGRNFMVSDINTKALEITRNRLIKFFGGNHG